MVNQSCGQSNLWLCKQHTHTKYFPRHFQYHTWWIILAFQSNVFLIVNLQKHEIAKISNHSLQHEHTLQNHWEFHILMTPKWGLDGISKDSKSQNLGPYLQITRVCICKYHYDLCRCISGGTKSDQTKRVARNIG